MKSLRENIAVLFLLLLHWEYGSAQSYSYYFRPGPGSEGSFNIGNPQQPFTGFSPQPPQIPFSGGTPPPGAQFYQYSLPGGNDEPTQQPRVIHQPIQYYQQQGQPIQGQQRHQPQPTVQYIPQQQPQHFIPQQQQQHALRFVQSVQPTQPQQPKPSPTPQPQPSQTTRTIQQIEENPVSQPPFEIRQIYVGQTQPTYSPIVLNNIGNVPNNRVEAINSLKGIVDSKSSEKLSFETKDINNTITSPLRFSAKTTILSVQQVRNEDSSDESEEDDDPVPVTLRGFPRLTSTAAAVTTRSTEVPITTFRATTPEAIPVTRPTTEQTRATVNEDQFVKPSPSSASDTTERNPFLPTQFPTVGRESENSSPFLPNQFSPQTQQFLPTQFTSRDPQSQFLPNQYQPSLNNGQFPPNNNFPPQNQYQQFPHQQFPPQFQVPSPDQYFQNQFPSADPPRPVQLGGGNRQEEGFTFRPFPSEIPEIENNSGEIEDEPHPFVSTTIRSEPSPSPSPETTTTTTTTRTSPGRGKSYYKFATPQGLYDTEDAIPLQQYSVTGNPEPEQQSTPTPTRKGRKRIRVNRNRFRQRPVAVDSVQQEPAIIPENQYEPIVSQAPVFINNVTPAPEDDITTYRSKFRFVPRGSTTAAPIRRPISEPSPVYNTNDNVEQNTGNDESAQAAINRRLQTLQRQIRFKTNNKNQDRKSG